MTDHPYRSHPWFHTALVRMLTLGIALFAFAVQPACSGAQRPSNGVADASVGPSPWIATAETSVAILADALPVVRGIINGLPIDPTAKAAALASIDGAESQLPQVRAAIAEYRSHPNIANICIARASIATLANTALGLSEAAGAAGFAMPALVLVAIGGLGSLVDELLPACPIDGGVGGGSFAAAMTARLGALPPNLRALPGAR